MKPPSDSEGEAMVCDENGECTPVGKPDYSGELKLGGFTYES